MGTPKTFIVRLCALLVWVCSFASQAAEPPAPLQLDAREPAREIQQRWVWTGPTPEADIDKVASGRVALRPADHSAVLPLHRGRSLWVRLRVQRSASADDAWVLQVPMPVLDSVVLYQQDAQGRWLASTSGDTHAINEWPEPGRYAYFRLHLPAGEARDLYLHIRHGTPMILPLRIVTAAEHDRRMRLEYLGLGMAFGALALLVAWGVVRAWRLQDPAYGWYAGYALISMLAVAAFTGIAFHLLWGHWPWWGDPAPGCLALLAGAAALAIVRTITQIVARTRWIGRAIRFTVLAGPLLAAVYLVVERRVGVDIAAGYLFCVTVLAVCAAVVTWRRGDAVGPWMTFGALPLALAVLVSIARVLGWIETSWLTDYALVLALTIDLPLLLAALNSRSRERRGAQLRQLAAESQDALTGLLKAKPFGAHLAQAMLRYMRRGENAAVAVIDLANYEWIKASRGQEAAEESLLRAVIKLRQLVRDVDTTGRIGEARFGLILEGVGTRAAVSQIGSRLIASGLMTDAERPGDPELQFHVGAVLLSEFNGNNEELTRGLFALLGSMSARTHRPFRFLEQQHSEPGVTSSGALEPEAAPLVANAK